MTTYEKTIIVRSGEIGPCGICGEGIKGGPIDDTDDWLEVQMNHLLGHDAELLHVGQESITGGDGERWETTVAVFGVSA